MAENEPVDIRITDDGTVLFIRILEPSPRSVAAVKTIPVALVAVVVSFLACALTLWVPTCVGVPLLLVPFLSLSFVSAFYAKMASVMNPRLLEAVVRGSGCVIDGECFVVILFEDQVRIGDTFYLLDGELDSSLRFELNDFLDRPYEPMPPLVDRMVKRG